MKLFLQDHRVLVLVNLLQVELILLVCWLDGFHEWTLLLYALLLCVFVLLCYLVYRYYILLPFYQRLSSALESLDESTQHYGFTPLGESLQDLLLTQYSFYQERLLKYRQQQQRQTTFVTQWVHQMKTPLSVISLLTQNEDDSRFESIREETERLQKGLAMVLYAARLDTFDRDFHVEPVNLFAIIVEVLRENKRLFIRNAVYPEVHVDQELLVLSDEKWLAFILDQLITNAVKYSAGTQTKISLSTSISKDSVELTVRDSGIGIPPEDLPRVFEPSFTGENGRISRQSTGMGLYLVHEACQELGHSLYIESTPGKGTIVHLTFVQHITPSSIAGSNLTFL
jgi:signal transduction histidine kinase